jgi:hypothetical protein
MIYFIDREFLLISISFNSEHQDNHLFLVVIKIISIYSFMIAFFLLFCF